MSFEMKNVIKTNNWDTGNFKLAAQKAMLTSLSPLVC